MNNLLAPLKIADLVLPTNLIQAPLAGYSCAPYRELIAHFGAAAYCCTEMLSAYVIAHEIPESPRYCYRSPQEGLLCYQLSGNHPQYLAQATARVTQMGADLVDLNCGCPQKKIRKKGHGSGLLAEPETLYQVLKSMRAATPLPLTAKIRVDGRSGESFNHAVVEAISAAGVDALIVHGRHWRERYDVPCRMEDIANIVRVASIPVIANGDAMDYAGVEKLLRVTQADGVMIARASMGQPWLFAKIAAEAAGLDFTRPDRAEVAQIFQRHIAGLAALEGEHKAELQSRSLKKYYADALQ